LERRTSYRSLDEGRPNRVASHATHALSNRVPDPALITDRTALDGVVSTSDSAPSLHTS
jgi:hypothetical protein